MAVTHFERLYNEIEKFDSQGRDFAKKAVKENRMAEALFNYVKGKRSKIPNNLSDRGLLSTLMPINHSVLSRCHHVTMELMKRHEDTFALDPLTDTEGYASVIGISCSSNDQHVVNAGGHMHYSMSAHRLAGRHVYEISSGLASRLRHTELRGLTSDDLELPYRSIYLGVPREADLKIWNDQSKWHKVIGVYVTEQVLPSRSWRFLVCGEPKPLAVAPGVVDDNDALVYFQVPLPSGLSLEKTLALSQDQCIKDVAELKTAGVDTFGPMVEVWPNIFKWAMNVVLYMSMPGVELKKFIYNKEARDLVNRVKKAPKGKKRARLQSRLSKLNPRSHVILGQSIPMNWGGWALTVRVRVRGHWRNQPYGPERMYRKLLWIEPHWRGPETDAELAEATTEVAPTSQGEPHDEPGNGTSDPTFGGTATLPTEGVVTGDQLLERDVPGVAEAGTERGAKAQQPE